MWHYIWTLSAITYKFNVTPEMGMLNMSYSSPRPFHLLIFFFTSIGRLKPGEWWGYEMIWRAGKLEVFNCIRLSDHHKTPSLWSVLLNCMTPSLSHLLSFFPALFSLFYMSYCTDSAYFKRWEYFSCFHFLHGWIWMMAWGEFSKKMEIMIEVCIFKTFVGEAALENGWFNWFWSINAW